MPEREPWRDPGCDEWFGNPGIEDGCPLPVLVPLAITVAVVWGLVAMCLILTVCVP